MFEYLQKELPKSGIKDWYDTQHELVQKIQTLLPDHSIGVIRAGKGLERYIVGDPGWQAQYPLRRTIVQRRGNARIEDLQCEDWSRLSRTQQHRKAVPSHIMICVFTEQDAVPCPEEPVPDSQIEVSGKIAEERDVPSHPVHVDIPTWTPLSATVSGPKFQALSAEDKGRIMKLHKNLGHPTAEKLARHLSEMNARQELVSGAREYLCASCSERHPPGKTTPGALKDAREFNERISIDGFEWKSQKGINIYVWHVIDESTRFHIGSITSRDSRALVKFMKDSWLQWAGPPKEIIHDEAGEFMTEGWKTFLLENGIQPILTASPWQRGRIERHGGIIKEMLSRIDHDIPMESHSQIETALRQSFHAKNTMSIVSGYSPEQAVFGRASKLPASLVSDEDLSTHLASDSESPDLASNHFQRNLALRTAARAAFSQADNSDAIRRAMNHQSRGMIHSWACGQLCMYWDKRKSPNMLEKGRWNGPAQVVCQESRSIIWISHLNRLLRCSKENLRPVSMREFQQHSTFAQTSSTTHLQQMADRLKHQLRERSGMFQYVDLSTISGGTYAVTN